MLGVVGGLGVRHLPGLCLPRPPPQWGGRPWCCCGDTHGAGEGTRRAAWGSWGGLSFGGAVINRGPEPHTTCWHLWRPLKAGAEMGPGGGART